EPSKRLHLFAEELDAHSALLGRGIDVEDPTPHRELTPLGHLQDALVPTRDEALERLREVEFLVALDAEPVWPKLRVGNPLRQRHRARHHDGRIAPAWLVEQGIERRDPEADEVGRRSELRFVADCPRGVEADDSRSKEGPEIDSEVVRGAIVGRNDKSRSRPWI